MCTREEHSGTAFQCVRSVGIAITQRHEEARRQQVWSRPTTRCIATSSPWRMPSRAYRQSTTRSGNG